MLISELIKELEQLKEKHGDQIVYATCHKNNMFYEPVIKWKSLQCFDDEIKEGYLICSREDLYGCVEGKIIA